MNAEAREEWGNRALTLKLVFSLLAKSSPVFFAGALMLFLAAAVLPYFRNLVIGDYVSGVSRGGSMEQGVVAIVLFSFASQVLQMFRRQAMQIGEAEVLKTMTPYLAKVRVALGISSFDGGNARLLSDAMDAEFWLRIFFTPLAMTISGIVGVTTGLCVIVSLAPRAGFVLLPLFVIILYSQGRNSVALAQLRRSSETARAETTSTAALFSERKRFESMAATGIVQVLLRRLERYAELLYPPQQRLILSRVRGEVLMWGVVFLALGVTIPWIFPKSDPSSLGRFTTVVFSIIGLLGELNLFAQYLGDAYEQTERLGDLARAYFETNAVKGGNVAVTPGAKPLDNSLVVRNLTWNYPGVGKVRDGGRRNIFENTSFEIQPGKVAWVQGLNGVGKTTLFIDLLLGLAPPPRNTIFLGGIDVTTIPDITNYVVGVGQDTLYLPFMIPEMFGVVAERDGQELSEEKLWEALRGVGLEEWVRKNGLRAVLHNHHRKDERGRVRKTKKSPSGGEQKKLYLALFLYHLKVMGTTNRTVLVLDEPFNHVDFPSQRKIMDELRATGATVIIVSHSTNLIEPEDQIVFLSMVNAEDGTSYATAQSGTFETLRDSEEYRLATGAK